MGMLPGLGPILLMFGLGLVVAIGHDGHDEYESEVIVVLEAPVAPK